MLKKRLILVILYEITKFEKQMRRLCSSINDTTLKKYILEDFLGKIYSLT